PLLCLRTGDDQLAHVADVEQPRALARPLVLGHDAFVLDQHGVAGERHHATSAGTVPAVEGKGFCCVAHLAGSLTYRSDRTSSRMVPIPPLSREPESFPRLRRSLGGLPLRWSAIAKPTTGAFQSDLNARSFCLRDSGAVAPSAVASGDSLCRA